MTPELLSAYAEQGYNRVPIVREVLADLDTPVSSYLKLADGPYSYLLESVHGDEKWGRYSIIGLPCTQVLKVYGQQVLVEENGRVIETQQCEDPLAFVDSFQARFKVPEIDGLPRFNGGLVGYFAYDTVRYIEPRLAKSSASDPLNTPDILLMVSDQLVVFDKLSGKLMLIYHVDPAQEDALPLAQTILDTLVHRLRTMTLVNSTATEAGQMLTEEDFVSGFSQDDFETAVDTIKNYIVSGDVMQTVISQRMSIPYNARPLDLYRSLRSLNPSPYMYFLNLDAFHIVGSSPEILVRVEDGELSETMVAEPYSYLMHLVSDVTGKLQANLSSMDVLRAIFPPGTLSGAPKVKAMKIIDELEPVKRGIYSGAVGYLSWNGNMDTATVIRTAIIKDNVLHIQAGAGVLANSAPRKVWEETMTKGRAIFRAAARAIQGMDSIDK